MREFTAVEEYRRRAVRYRHWDLLLQGTTRFFAAASIVADTLAYANSPGGWLVTNHCSRRFLLQLGSDLECVNLDVARRLLAGGPLPMQHELGHDHDHDFAIVRAEQHHVEAALRTLGSRSPGRHRRILADLNRLLSWLSCPVLPPHPTMRLLQCAVRTARADLGRTPDFARQSDRECIGNQLIGVVRDSLPGPQRCRGPGTPAARDPAVDV